MASKKFGGFIDKLVMGAEKSEDYARKSLPSNRWELFWDIVKGSFGKLFVINLLTLLFFIPLIALIVIRYFSLVTYGTLYPFASGFGVGYMAPVFMSGMAENIEFSSTITTFLLLPIAGLIAAIGLSGGLYVIRNMVWTEGVFVANDFWRGIKKNFKQISLTCVIYSVIFYLFYSAILLANLNISTGVEPVWLSYVIIIVSIITLVFVSVMAFHMLAMSVTYELTFIQLIKNAFWFTLGNPISSIFFIALGSIPIILLFCGEFFMGIALILIIIFGLSLLMLVWTNFSQWLYDKYVNDKVAGATKNRGIYEKVGKNDQSESVKKYKQQLDAIPNGMLSNKPIKPITDEELTLAELPQTFNRQDIARLNESRQVLYEDNEKYVAEHMTDEQIVKAQEAQKQYEVIDDEKQKRIEQAKRELAKRDKRKKKRK